MDNGGRYEGTAIVELLEDGRRVRLNQPYSYIDPDGTRWDVPAKAIVDGASIPKVLWSIIGGPFEGKYRAASIIHDWYCDIRLRNWKDVHRMFYNAMLTSGVARVTANIMYAGVYAGGPRWSDTVVENTRTATGVILKVTAGAAGQPVMPIAYSGRRGVTVKKSAAKKSAAKKSAAKKSVMRPGKWRISSSAPTTIKKPRVRRSKLESSQLEALRASINGRMGAEDIEHLVESMRNSKPATRKR